MRRFGCLETLALAALAGAAGPAPVCSALPLTLAYSGYVYDGISGAPYPAATPFQGTVTYDSAVSPESIEGSSRAEYLFREGFGAVSFSVGETLFEGATSDDAAVAMLELIVEDDHSGPLFPGGPSSRPRDRYLYLFGQNQVGILEIEFRTSNSLVSLPDLESIQDLEIPTASSQFERLAMSSVRYQDPIGGWVVFGDITSISVVPEPSTIHLVALGIAALAAARSRTRPQRAGRG